MKNPSLRREIYLLLSEAFKQPTAEYIAEQPDIVTFLRQSFAALDYALPSMLYENWPELAPDLPTAAAAYRRSFLFPVQTRIVPVESVYRRWTADSSAEVPFAAEKGLLMSDHALHMKSLYDSFGITLPSGYQAMPDHLCLELEFAALLLENQEIEKYRLFIREHLDWLDEMAEDAEKKAIPGYYLQVVKVTAQFLSLELRHQRNTERIL